MTVTIQNGKMDPANILASAVEVAKQLIECPKKIPLRLWGNIFSFLDGKSFAMTHYTCRQFQDPTVLRNAKGAESSLAFHAATKFSHNWRYNFTPHRLNEGFLLHMCFKNTVTKLYDEKRNRDAVFPLSQLDDIVGTFPKLQRLSLITDVLPSNSSDSYRSTVQLSQSILKLDSLHFLKLNLNGRYPTFDGFVQIKKTINDLRTLRELELNFSGEVSLILPPSLQVLRLRNVVLYKKSEVSFETCDIQHLDLTNSRFWLPFLDALKDLSLKTLSLCGSTVVDADTPAEIVARLPKHLEEIDVSNCKIERGNNTPELIGENALKELFSDFPNIKKLTLKETPQEKEEHKASGSATSTSFDLPEPSSSSQRVGSIFSCFRELLGSFARFNLCD